MRAEDTPDKAHSKGLTGRGVTTFPNVPVRRLDELFEAPFPVRLMKMDVQGYECNVMHGASPFFGAGCVQSLTAEASDPWLRAQHCSLPQLISLMNGSGLAFSTRRTCDHCREKTIVARARGLSEEATCAPERLRRHGRRRDE